MGTSYEQAPAIKKNYISFLGSVLCLFVSLIWIAREFKEANPTFFRLTIIIAATAAFIKIALNS